MTTGTNNEEGEMKVSTILMFIGLCAQLREDIMKCATLRVIAFLCSGLLAVAPGCNLYQPDQSGEGGATGCAGVVSYYADCGVDADNIDRMEKCCTVSADLFSDTVAWQMFDCIWQTSCETILESVVLARQECLIGMLDTIEPTGAHDAFVEAECNFVHNVCGGGDYDNCVTNFWEEDGEGGEDAMISLWFSENAVQGMADCIDGLSDGLFEDGVESCFDAILADFGNGELCWGGDED